MNIELDASTTNWVKRKAIDQAVKQLTAEIFSQFDAKQIAGEVRNAAVHAAAQLIASEIRTTYKTHEAVERALASAEETVRREITDRLTNGIIVRFSDPH